MTKPKIKPCPHCGGEGKVILRGVVYVECQTCGATGQKFHYEIIGSIGGIKKAIAAWNKRTADAEILKMLDELQAEVLREYCEEEGNAEEPFICMFDKFREKLNNEPERK